MPEAGSEPQAEVAAWSAEDCTEADAHRLAQVVAQTHESVVITDMLGNIEYVNPAFERTTGYSRQEALGANPRVLKSGVQSPELYEELWSTITSGKTWSGRLSNRRKNGELYVEEATITPIVDANGETCSFVAVKREITEQVGLEAHLRATFDQGFVGMGHADLDGVLIRTNERFATMLGFGAPSELVGVPLSRISHPEDAPADALALGGLLSGASSSYQREQRFLRPDGAEVWAELFVTLVRRSDRSPSFLTFVCHDLTERKRMEVDLRHAQKLETVGQLAAGIAHEINTPTQYVSDNVVFLERAFSKLLVVASTATSLLDDAEAGSLTPERIASGRKALAAAKLAFLEKQVPPAFEQSIDGLARIAKIVGAMKEFSHPSRGEKTTVDLNHAVETTLAVARNEWKYVADMVLKLDPTLPPFPALRDELSQVILNLVVNAAHAIAAAAEDRGEAADKGTITISTYLDGEFVTLSIEDNGTGIPESIREKIFDPFFTTKQVGKGTGQGLAIARSIIIDKHGGTIDVASEEGRGTTFIVRLPLTDPGVATASEPG